jgi:hypothetical protein
MTENKEWEVEISTDNALVSLTIWNVYSSEESAVSCQFSVN